MNRVRLGIYILLGTLLCQNTFAGGSSSKASQGLEDDSSEISSVPLQGNSNAQNVPTSQLVQSAEEKKEESKVSSQSKEPNPQESAQPIFKQIINMTAKGPRSLIEQCIGFEGKTNLRASCETAQRVIHRQKNVEVGPTVRTKKEAATEKEIAQEKIRRMVGELKWVEPGSFLMGSEEGEPDYIYEGEGLNQKPHFVEIKEGYWLPVDDMTVANYHYVMTGQWITKENQKVKEELEKEKTQKNKKHALEEKEEKNSKKAAKKSKYPDLAFLIENEKKPMRGLMEAEWDAFIKKLNEKMAKEWPVGYPDLYKAHGNKPPVFDRPEDQELEFATTIPLKKEMEVDNPGRQMDEKAPPKVKITAKHSLFSGTDRKVKFDKYGQIPQFDKENKETEDYKEISKYVVFQKDWSAGPSDVDSVLPNERGFRNLSGNIWKQTKTPFKPDVPTDTRRVVVGGDWDRSAELARSASRRYWNPAYPRGGVGFRPCARSR